jgi:heme/copper-type cytochrome/quinol oxidase subunit 2
MREKTGGNYMDNNNQFDDQNQQSETTRPYQNYVNNSAQGGQYSQYDANGSTMNQSMQQGGYQIPMEEPMSVGDWLIIMLIMTIPCVSIVMMFIWAFSNSEKKSKSNYFKARLIWALIWIVLSIVFTVVLGASVMSLIPQLTSYY